MFLIVHYNYGDLYGGSLLLFKSCSLLLWISSDKRDRPRPYTRWVYWKRHRGIVKL